MQYLLIFTEQLLVVFHIHIVVIKLLNVLYFSWSFSYMARINYTVLSLHAFLSSINSNYMTLYHFHVSLWITFVNFFYGQSDFLHPSSLNSLTMTFTIFSFFNVPKSCQFILSNAFWYWRNSQIISYINLPRRLLPTTYVFWYF